MTAHRQNLGQRLAVMMRELTLEVRPYGTPRHAPALDFLKGEGKISMARIL